MFLHLLASAPYPTDTTYLLVVRGVNVDFIFLLLGAVHILRQPLEGGSQMLTIADEGGRGGKPNDDHCWRRGEGGSRNP